MLNLSEEDLLVTSIFEIELVVFDRGPYYKYASIKKKKLKFMHGTGDQRTYSS
jgi:hypothetical protein